MMADGYEKLIYRRVSTTRSVASVIICLEGGDPEGEENIPVQRAQRTTE